MSGGGVELRYTPARVAPRTAAWALAAVGASLLAAAFGWAGVLRAEARFGAGPLLLTWLALVAAVAVVAWRRLTTFTLRADELGLSSGYGRILSGRAWLDVAAAVAEEPGAPVTGREYAEGVAVVLRDADGRVLWTLPADLGGGFDPEETAAFKRYVAARLEAYGVPREGPALAWLHWQSG